MPSSPPQRSAFGQQLRYWRRLRSLSQLRLATLADTTPRHVSFVETGRSRPGRDLILRIGRCLDLPLRDRNALLAAAGFAPAHPERGLDAQALRPVSAAIRAILAAHDPYPAAAVDARGRTLLANAASRRLFPGALERSAEEAVDAFFGGWGPAHVENWPEVAWSAVDRRRRLAAGSADPELVHLADRAQALLDGVPRPSTLALDEEPPLVYARLRLRGERLSVFSAVLRFETSRDVTLAELGVELVFPADDPTADFFRRQAAADA